MTEDIKDYAAYNQKMSTSILDKLFFLTQVDFSAINAIVDFGCADGTLLQTLTNFPELQNMYFVGVDSNPEMRRLAEEKLAGRPNTLIIDSLDNLPEVIKPKNSLLNLSSVVHELYSYNENSIISPLRDIFNYDFKIIALRDMYFNLTAAFEKLPPDRRDVCYLPTLNSLIRAMWREYKDLSMIDKFEVRYGKIVDLQQTIHLLLKFDYQQNMTREVTENYFNPIIADIQQFGAKYNVNGTFYILPYLSQRWRKLGIDVPEELFTTHCRLILERKNGD